MFKSLRRALLPVCLLLLAGRASANCLPVVCSVFVFISSNSGGIVLSGSGTNSVTMAFGTVQAFGGILPTGVTRTVSASSFTISTTVNIYIYCEDLELLGPCVPAESPSFLLLAQLQTADTKNTWTIGGQTVVGGTPTTITAAGTYGVSTPYSASITIPFSESAGGVANTINFVAITN